MQFRSITMDYHESIEGGPDIIRRLLIRTSIHEGRPPVFEINDTELRDRYDRRVAIFFYPQMNTLGNQLYDVFDFWLDTPKNTFNDDNFVRAYNESIQNLVSTYDIPSLIAVASGTHPRVGALSPIQRLPPELLQRIMRRQPITKGVPYQNGHI